jgi:ElaB/YqjD/DUF883 family membrane-anchored ribosome-binding protein
MFQDTQTPTPAGARAAGHNGSDHVAGSSSGLVREYHKLLADLEDLIGSASTLTSEELGRAKAALTSRVASARASALQMGNAVTERVQAGARATDQYVHNQPWQAVGISAVAGILVGFLIGRRSS